MIDRGFTHVALFVADLDASVTFYQRYAAMKTVHERREPASQSRVAWLSDGTRPFALVLVAPERLSWRRRIARWIAKLFPSSSHLGVACASREEVESLCELAGREGRLRKVPRDLGPPVGFYGMLADPDGNTLELSYGQEVRLTVERAERTRNREPRSEKLDPQAR